jgi:hypothetical protein
MRILLTVSTMLITAACQHPAPDVPSETSPAPTETRILTPPFTAEEIRDRWTRGLQITIRQISPEGSAHQRWSVVEWSQAGCAIEHTALADDGTTIGEPMVQQATWSELRDHAAFPADHATRTITTRNTPLGTLRGWLYEVHDPTGGAVSRFFFAEDLPGAPLWMETTVNGKVVSSMEQIARNDFATQSVN